MRYCKTYASRLRLWIHYSLFIIILLSCGHTNTLDIQDFVYYVDLFEKESIIHNNPQKVTDLIIKFVDNLPENDEGNKTIGNCRTSLNTTPKITIDKTYWEFSNYEIKEILIFHEMGHCVLDLDHNDSKPAIMNSELLNGYIGKRQEFLKDYFQGE